MPCPRRTPDTARRSATACAGIASAISAAMWRVRVGQRAYSCKASVWALLKSERSTSRHLQPPAAARSHLRTPSRYSTLPSRWDHGLSWSKFTPFEIAVTTHMVMPAPVTAKAAIVHTIHVQRLNVGCLSSFSACVGACTTSEAETRDHLFLRQLRQHRVQQLKRW